MEKVVSFFRDSYFELKNNVTTIKGKELQSKTILVAVASVLFALLIYSMDSILRYLSDLIYSNF